MGQRVSAELFRRADNRGFHTRLLSPPGAALQERGIAPEEPYCWPAGNELRSQDSSKVLTHAVLLPPPVPLCTKSGVSEQSSLWDRFLSACLSSRAFTSAAFQLDFLEVYAGTARLSQAFLAQGFRVGPPIELQLGWDLDRELFVFILGLCRARKLGLLWLGPPCKTFSLARCPKGRSLDAPWGLDPLDWDTAEGNLHLHQSLALFLAQAVVELEAIVETPWGAYARKLPWWKYAVAKGCEFRVDQCRYGTPYLKPTALLCTSSKYSSIGRRCKCLVPHLEGCRSLP